MKIALVKQDVYQDLYVCKNRAENIDILRSTLMRVGPFGLFTLFDADFFIIQEQPEPECKIYKKSYNPGNVLKKQLRTLKACELDVGVFQYLKPYSSSSHADFSVADPGQIDWSLYDVVISINITVPKRIVRLYPNTLWCYMIGEANAYTSRPVYGYDVSLSQNVTGVVASKLGAVDFPYTFLGPTCLETLAREYFGDRPRTSVYAEINTTTERPVRSVPQLEFVKDLGYELLLHDQDVLENIRRLYCSKYFIKIGGRKIRGNSVIEAISAGALVIMDPKDLEHSQLLPKELWIHDRNEAEALIKSLDNDPSSYERLRTKQRELFEFFVNDAPIESLKNCLSYKRQGLRPEGVSLKKRIKTILRSFNS